MFPLYPFSVWKNFSFELNRHISVPVHTGKFTSKEAGAKDLRLAEGSQGHYVMGHCICLYWLVDPETGIVIDAKFQAFGSPLLVGIADFLCEEMIGKTYFKGKNIGFNTIENKLDISKQLLSTSRFRPYLNLCLDALDDAVSQCSDIPCEESSSEVSIFESSQEPVRAFTEDEWNTFSPEERLTSVKQVFSVHIESFLLSDGGGATIDSIDDDNCVSISYTGNCSGCFSSVGSTLSSIEHILQTYVFHKINIKINENSLNFHPFD